MYRPSQTPRLALSSEAGCGATANGQNMREARNDNASRRQGRVNARARALPGVPPRPRLSADTTSAPTPRKRGGPLLEARKTEGTCGGGVERQGLQRAPSTRASDTEHGRSSQSPYNRVSGETSRVVVFHCWSGANESAGPGLPPMTAPLVPLHKTKLESSSTGSSFPAVCCRPVPLPVGSLDRR